MKAPRGFLLNGIHSGIKNKAKDLGIIISQNKALAVGFFTTNEFSSESLLVCKEHIKKAKAQAIIVNSGNANCARGKEGIEKAKKICQACARHLGVYENNILIASTGIIGKPLPEKKIISHIEELIKNSSLEKIDYFARAIMTTDRYPKVISFKLKNGVRILGVAKGAGMIEPNLATTLCFLLTDAKIKKNIFKKILQEAIELTFNRISIDGEQSTNDTFIALANGASGIDIEKPRSGLKEFIKGVFFILGKLAYFVVENGEGATKVIRINIKGARSRLIAKKISQRLASSLLFKSSLYGNSANWGRIISALGSLKLGLGRKFDIYYGKIKVVDKGVSLYYKKKDVEKYLKKNKEIEITVDLNAGNSGYWIYTTDLTPEYVEVNR